MTCPVTGLSEITLQLVKPILRLTPSIGTKITLYDQITFWTSEHLSLTQLNEWRYLGDPVIDRFFDEYSEQLQDNEDTYAFLEKLSLTDLDHHCDESCRDVCVINFVKDIRQRPEWFDRALIQRGQQFALKYGPITLMSVFSYTLIFGYGFQQLNDVLVKTQYLSSPNLFDTYRRLVETTQMIVHAVSGDVDNFDQTFLDVVRVRLLHGMVRHKLKKYNQQVPINQEDSLITLLGFAFGVLYSMEERMGIPISEEDKHAYLHLWRYIGWVIGIKDEFLTYLSSYRSARVISESIFYHFYHPSTISKHLAHHALISVYNHSPISIPYRIHFGLSQVLIGEEISQALGIDQPKTDLIHRGIIQLVFRLFRCHHWVLNWNISFLNEWIMKNNKQKFAELIKEHLRNFALFKPYKTDSSTAVERTSVKGCPCGYYQKKHQRMIETNDLGSLTISVLLRSLVLILCFFFFLFL